MKHSPPISQLSQKETFLVEKALAALQNSTGLLGKLVQHEPQIGGNARADALVEIEAAGQRYQYLAEIKQVDRFAVIGQIKILLDQYPKPGLLIAHRLTAEMADKCRELGVQFIDTQGNAFLRGPGWFVLVKGERALATAEMEGATRGESRAGTATALRTNFALLCYPDLLNAPYRDIKQTAGVALGAIGWIFHDLSQRGLITGGAKKGDRRILEHKRMIEEWVTNYPIKLRPKLNARKFHAEDPNWWKDLDVAGYAAFWGGEVAADKLTGHLKPATVTLYMHPEHMGKNLSRLVADYKLRAAPDGEIEVLEAFWYDKAGSASDMVPPLLVYADLLVSMDPRNLSIGKMILEQHLHAPENQK